MAAPAITVLLYRMRNPNGTSKDWAVPTVLDPQRLTVYFGRTGSTLRQAETPAGRCRDGIPIREAEDRIREKMAKGYQALGTFRLAANRRDLTPVSTSPPDAGHGRDTPETSNAVPALYWRWRPTGGVETARRRVLDTACTEIIAGLAAVGWTLPDCSPEARDGWVIWSSVTQDAHQGVVPLTEAYKPLIAFFLSLARRAIDLTVADEQGQIITAWPAELPVEAAILETLGLRPKDLNQLLTGSGGDTWFF
jgi:hypothetical protein